MGIGGTGDIIINMDNGGSTLIEALFATALVAVALSPSILAFRSQLAAEDHLRRGLIANLAIESATDNDSATAPQVDEPVENGLKTDLAVTDETPCGDATLIRSVAIVRDGERIVRERIIYEIRGKANDAD